MPRAALSLVATCTALLLALFSTADAATASTSLAPLEAATEPYSEAAEAILDYTCLTSGVAVTGRGRKQYCIDVPPADGTKVVVTVDTPRPALEVVRVGRQTYLRPSNLSETVTTTTAVGPIIEVKPFLQACERCDLCPCIGCGDGCECSCNALCRLRREPSCTHTAGVLAPGRWYVSVDAPAAFTMRATLVAALALRAGETIAPRTLFGAGTTQGVRDAGATEGAAFVDYYYYDPAPHESLELQIELLRAGSRSTFVDVYVRFGEFPTSLLHDARMRVDQVVTPHATFVLRADRLLNERLCVMVVSPGDAWATYAVRTTTAASTQLLAALLLLVVPVLLAVAGALWRIRKGSGKAGLLAE